MLEIQTGDICKKQTKKKKQKNRDVNTFKIDIQYNKKCESVKVPLGASVKLMCRNQLKKPV